MSDAASSRGPRPARHITGADPRQLAGNSGGIGSSVAACVGEVLFGARRRRDRMIIAFEQRRVSVVALFQVLNQARGDRLADPLGSESQSARHGRNPRQPAEVP